MTNRYSQAELNVYGAADDEEMDAILAAVDTAVHEVGAEAESLEDGPGQ